MSVFNFKSSPCTSREQSKRLLALGLKKETADCYWWQENDQYGDGNGKWHLEVLDTKEAREHFEYLDKIFDDDLFFPAWSMHRMWEFICNRKKYKSKEGDEYPNIYLNDDCVIVENPKSIWARHNFCSSRGVYENVINCIEWLIKEGYFNKEHLNGTTEN